MKRTFYTTGHFQSKLIEEVQVEKCSKTNVWIDGERHLINGVCTRYWKTQEQAKKHLQEKYQRILSNAQFRLEHAKQKLEELKQSF